MGLVIAYPDTRSKIIDLIDIEDFSAQKHRTIFQAIKDVIKSGRDVDRVVLSEHMVREGTLQDSGGLTYLVSLEEGLPNVPSQDGYIRILKDYRALRGLIALSGDIQKRVASSAPPAETLGYVSDRIANIEHACTALNEAPSIEDLINKAGGPLAILKPINRFIPTGFTRLDQLIGGLEPGTVTIFAGSASSGKTSAAMNVAQYAAEHEVPVLVFSMEMSARQIMDRMIAGDAGVDLMRFLRGKLNQTEDTAMRASMAHVYGLPIYIEDKAPLLARDISAVTERMKRAKGVRVVVVDYVQLMTNAASTKGKTTSDVLGGLIIDLKNIAKRTDTAFVVLSQLNRASTTRKTDNRPILSDLRDSGGLEQTADKVMFIYREFLHKPDRTDLRDRGEFIVGKNRNGSTGQVDMGWTGIRTRFWDLP